MTGIQIPSVHDHFLLQVIRVLLDIFRASSLMLFEGAVVAIIKEHGGDYGLQVRCRIKCQPFNLSKSQVEYLPMF